MKQIRRGVFETNSSSCHSICIAKGDDYLLDKSIDFNCDEFGWEQDARPLKDYLYSLIVSSLPDYEVEYVLDKIETILNKHGVECSFEELRYETSKWGTYLENDCYVDHGYEAKKFVDAVLNDENLLLRALFHPDSVVYTGNDNCCDGNDGNSMCYCALPTSEYYDEEKDEWVDCPNPNHDIEKYDYFFKGN